MIKPFSLNDTLLTNLQIRIGVFCCLLFVLWACTDSTVSPPIGDNPSDSTVTIQPQILSELPHDNRAFTQGLLWKDSLFYESTGLYGGSSLRKVDPASGTVLQRVDVASAYFAEGLVLRDSLLVQLTWQAGIAFVYRLTDFTVIDTFLYNGQGWGITCDSTSYIMSNGSSTIVFRDWQFNVVRQITVALDGVPVSNLNELEYVNGRIYANVWRDDIILEILPDNGRVTRVLDCSELVLLANAGDPNRNVLNGIAYRPSTETFFLTGKNWPKIFEVRLPAESRIDML